MANEKKQAETKNVKPKGKPESNTKRAAPGNSSINHAEPEKKKLAIILLRGLINVRGDILQTLFDLRLRKKHVCVVIDENMKNRNLAMKCKDYVTYGEIDEETYALLIEKRGKKATDGKIKKYFTLHPPRGGFERKGIKNAFTRGGALGHRGPKMNDLIRKML